MEQRPEPNQTSYGEYRGQPAQQPSTPYGADEMPQSTYPHDGPGASSAYDPYGSTNQQQQQYGQQQQYQYGQQQQYQYQYQYQAPFFGQPGDVGPLERTSMGLKARTAGVLSYLATWITGIIFILIERENRFVRFHAMQSILFFGGLSIIEWIAGNVYILHSLSWGLGIVQLVCWIFLMVKAGQGKYYKLPLVGDYAERFANQIK
jgi:uncharacterized membrane protein